ncbi:uncharacterized protein PITG_05414 [Phytophthora infestans T30-4]|uniref:PNPLA domain-containing protein n=1 Tax=Phytophthora infestans (strain T30-4) TaxID=403677 RepID=D0N2R9_PHYIT|nr:uncharacterized protein PITG_05414 [Phytophthora infestans T30-4]EEY69211.1 conserved hypothetical protein [Phytophthora infestans T30-4]|eukprot:XP_002999065.1 conserved hypothetical protein [Phytophthora infestans T30-4]
MARRHHDAALKPSSYSFAAGGYLITYLFGVAKALQEFELEKDARLIGTSAGCNFDATLDYVLKNVIPGARVFLADTLKAVGNLHTWERLNVSQQLTIVYTSLSALTSRRQTTFDSRQQLTDTLMAACCATPIAGLPFRLGDEWVFDGGILDFQPVFDEKTVTVSPFYCTGADIKPSVYVPMWWSLLAPRERDAEWLFDLGYEDGLKWIVKNNLTGNRKNVVIPNKSAEYASEWSTTVGRVVGYRGFESRVLDALFVGLFVCLWRPLAFMCLYLELYLQAIVSGSKAVIFGAAAKLFISNIIMVVLAVATVTQGFQHTLLFILGLTATGFFLEGTLRPVGVGNRVPHIKTGNTVPQPRRVT